MKSPRMEFNQIKTKNFRHQANNHNNFATRRDYLQNTVLPIKLTSKNFLVHKYFSFFNPELFHPYFHFLKEFLNDDFLIDLRFAVGVV